MTKARLVPQYFGSSPSDPFHAQLDTLRTLLAGEAELLPPRPIGTEAPGADAVLVPEMLGEAYRRTADFTRLGLPVFVITSEFGTVAMWDWEIIGYLRDVGVQLYAPSSLERSKMLCRALAVRRELGSMRFVVFQDNPGEGQQAPIFKRFYWWEQESAERMFAKFGIRIEKRSFRALGERARAISDRAAAAEWKRLEGRVPIGDMPERSLYGALKLYLAVKQEISADGRIAGVGINCLNESHFSDTTPCLAWNLLYEERGLIWGCEADTLSMLTKYLLNKVLRVPVMMTNLYPFLMGHAALKHERIPEFPKVEGRPEDHLLAAHCGYFGVVPQSFAADWTLRRKVLAIVHDDASAIDARMATGPITLAKIETNLSTLFVTRGELLGYAQYRDSDCLNGAVIRVDNGPGTVARLPSHHAIIATGDNQADIELAARLFDLAVRTP